MGIYDIHADPGFISFRLPAKLKKFFKSAKTYYSLPRLIEKATEDGIMLAYKELN